ncbi:DNA polymerase domain-containing protein, partial [Clostridium perfringens]
DELRTVGQFVGQYVTEKFPKLFTIERLKKNRGDKIYFDYLQHYSGRTLAAPYTPRARRLGTVSTPLTWDEVRQDVSPTDFHLLNIEERLREKGDLLQTLPPQPIENVIRHLKPQGKGASKRKG